MQAMRTAWRDADDRALKWAVLGMETGGFEALSRDERRSLSRPIDDFCRSLNLALPHISESIGRDLLRWKGRFVLAVEPREFWDRSWGEDFEALYLLLGAERERSRAAENRGGESIRVQARSPSPSKVAAHVAKHTASELTRVISEQFAKFSPPEGQHKTLRPIPIALAAKQLGMRPDLLKKTLVARGHKIYGKPRQFAAEFEAIAAINPRLRQGFTEWADKHYPAS